MPVHVRIRLLLVLALLLIVAALGVATETQRRVSERSFAQTEAAERRLGGMLDQSDGLFHYLEHRDADELAQVRRGSTVVEREILRAGLNGTDLSRRMRDRLDREAVAIGHWQELADAVLAAPDDAEENEEAREHALDGYREANRATLAEVRAERLSAQKDAQRLSAGVLAALVLLLGLPAYLIVERSAHRGARRAGDDERFGEAIQFARTQDDAYEVLRRHLDITLVKGTAVVLNRNNSSDRLEPRTPVEPGTPLAEALEGASPDDCLAVRRGTLHRRRAGEPELLSCEVCGAVGENVTCAPSLVGGEVIGSVLVQHAAAPRAGEEERLRTAVAEAAPIIANLRNLEFAEARAMTDALTGLPNKRSLDEALKRMVAQAVRHDQPLAGILFDLDHFKLVNDRQGHEAGDEVLAAVGAAIPSALRASDLAGRFGGEEFLALLPGTTREGALLVAEKLRLTIASVIVGDAAMSVTASFGVAAIPEDAADGAELLRVADRALYRAKANGRNRVESLDPVT